MTSFAALGVGGYGLDFPTPLMGTGSPGNANPGGLASYRGCAVSSYSASKTDTRLNGEKCKAGQRRELSENARIFFELSVSERPKDLASI